MYHYPFGKPPVSRQLSNIVIFSFSLSVAFFLVKIFAGHNRAYSAAPPLKEVSSVLTWPLVRPLHKAVLASVTTYCCPIKKCICVAQAPFENKTYSLSDSNKAIRDQLPLCTVHQSSSLCNHSISSILDCLFSHHTL